MILLLWIIVFTALLVSPFILILYSIGLQDIQDAIKLEDQIDHDLKGENH